jgi:hypothetical protein
MGDRRERGFFFRITGIGRRRPSDQESLRDAYQLSARVNQLEANGRTAEENLRLDVVASMTPVDLPKPERGEVINSIITGTRELEVVYCSLALIDVAVEEGLSPLTIVHLVDGLRESVTKPASQESDKE